MKRSQPSESSTDEKKAAAGGGGAEGGESDADDAAAAVDERLTLDGQLSSLTDDELNKKVDKTSKVIEQCSTSDCA